MSECCDYGHPNEAPTLANTHTASMASRRRPSNYAQRPVNGRSDLITAFDKGVGRKEIHFLDQGRGYVNNARADATLYSDVASSFAPLRKVMDRLAGGSAVADHILRKIGDHLRRSCTGAAVYRDLLHSHAAHRSDPSDQFLGSAGQGCFFEDLLIDQRRVLLLNSCT